MTVNTQRPHYARPGPIPVSGQRLYLREEELDAGLALILEAGFALKASTLTIRQANDLNWTEARTLASVLVRPQGVLALSVRLDITKQTAIKTVEALECRGFVKRSDDPSDGRKRLINLTPKGEAIARDIGGAMRNLMAKAYRQAGGEAVTGCDAVLSALQSAGSNP